MSRCINLHSLDTRLAKLHLDKAGRDDDEVRCWFIVTSPPAIVVSGQSRVGASLYLAPRRHRYRQTS